jgi:nucleoside-diphosphate-sugar epimerase
VTGASSLIGGVLVERLVDHDFDVIVLQRRTAGLEVEERLGDVADRSAVEAAVRGVDAVVHLAARASVTGSWESFERTNVGGTRNVIEAAHAAGVGRFVHVSSPSVAHTGESLIGAAAGPANPGSVRGHYARSKAMAELIVLGANSPDMPVVAIRPHLIWGPGDTQLVGRIVERAKAGRLAVIGSGAALIDSTYVDNAADSLVAALERAPEIGGRAFVVSNGQPRPVGEMLNRIAMAAGAPVPRLKVPYAVARGGGRVVEGIWERRGNAGEPPITQFLAEQLGTAHWFDQRETRTALRWSPEVGIEEGFRRLQRWFESA